MEMPEWLLDLAHAAVAEHPDSIASALNQLERKARQHKEFKATIDNLIWQALQELIYDVRHHVSNQTKKPGAEPYLGPPKVRRDESPSLPSLHSKMESIYIGGTSLASVKGEDMEYLAAEERRFAGGHLLNARLLERLRPLTPDGKCARDTVSAREFDRILCEERRRGEAA